MRTAVSEAGGPLKDLVPGSVLFLNGFHGKHDCFEVANSKIEWKNNRIEIEINEIATPFPKRINGKMESLE